MLYFLGRRRLRHVLLCMVYIFGCVTLVSMITSGGITGINLGFSKSVENIQIEPIDANRYGVYARLFKVLAESKPKCKPLTHYKKKNAKIQRFANSNEKAVFTKPLLDNLLKFTQEDRQKIQEGYKYFMENKDSINMHVFGNESPNREIQGSGVVIVGGGKYSWLALLNIHQLRKTGSELPVEVFIPTAKEYDRYFCDQVLPSLNAKCVLGFKELPLKFVTSFFTPKNYDFKILAILCSKFENILLLDSDNLVLHNPDELFEWETYKDYQMVLWPDVWHRTTNPFLFELLDIQVNYFTLEDLKKINFHDLPGSVPNPSTESGMILVNKRAHVDTLLLSLYLNIFGSDVFYPLITQGGAGEGDKDTYILAAHAMKNPVYQVKQHIKFVGHFFNEKFVSGGLGQCNPMNEREIHANRLDPCEELLFVHLLFPKFFPDEITKNFIDKKGNHFLELDPTQYDYDFELQIWEIMAQLLCSQYTTNSFEIDNPASELLNTRYKESAKHLNFINRLNIESICNSDILPHLEFLREYFSKH